MQQNSEIQSPQIQTLPLQRRTCTGTHEFVADAPEGKEDQNDEKDLFGDTNDYFDRPTGYEKKRLYSQIFAGYYLQRDSTTRHVQNETKNVSGSEKLLLDSQAKTLELLQECPSCRYKHTGEETSKGTAQ